MKDITPFKLSDEFYRRASPDFKDRSGVDTPEMSIRRPPVQERKTADFSRHHMNGYVRGLEQRLIKHLERHSPVWHRKETVEKLNEWHSLQNNHPAPQGVAPRNLVREASEYVAHRVEARLNEKFKPLDAAKMKLGLFDDSIEGVMQRAQRRADLRDKMRIR